MSLPTPWVQKIFAKLAVTYGRDFLSRWEGQDLAAVMADWGHELRAYAQSPNAIGFALEHLPSSAPPTVLEFRQLCRGYSKPVQAALPGTAGKPATEVVSKVREALAFSANRAGRAWALRLKQREASGEHLSMAQCECWREALGVPRGFSARDELPRAAALRAETVVDAQEMPA